MASPQNIRAFAPIPFPALVVAQAPVTVTKANGIWTIGFSIAQFGSINPPIGNFQTDYLLGYDAIANTFFKVSIANLNVGGGRTQRSATGSPIVVAATDQIINFNINAGAPTCALPPAASRNGVPLTFKDSGGHAAAHNLTITPNGAETIDGLANVKITTNYGEITLVPYNDGTNAGWALS